MSDAKDPDEPTAKAVPPTPRAVEKPAAARPVEPATPLPVPPAPAAAATSDTAAQAIPAMAEPAEKLAASARELAASANSVAVAARGGAIAAAEGRGARVISGEVLPPRRRSRKGYLIAAVLLLAIGAGGYYGFNWWTTGRFIISTDDAYIAADMSVLAAKIPGYITDVGVSDNQHVVAGTVLARIDDGDYKLAVDAAANRLATQDATIERIGTQITAQNAAIAQARAQLESAKAELVRAQAAFDRAQKLAANEFGTKAALDQARADRDKAVAAIAASQSALDAANAAIDVLKAQRIEAVRARAELVTALDRAKRDLSFTEIRAPFDGVVGNRAVEVGQYVQTGMRVMALVPLDTVRVDANLKETQLADVKPGQPVDVRVDAFGGRIITGHVESISPASGSLFSLLPPENATGNFTKIVQRLPVRIALPRDIVELGILRPGMSVVVGINTKAPGTQVIGEDIPRRVALIVTRIRDAALRMFNSSAVASPTPRAGAVRTASAGR